MSLRTINMIGFCDGWNVFRENNCKTTRCIVNKRQITRQRGESTRTPLSANQCGNAGTMDQGYLS